MLIQTLINFFKRCSSDSTWFKGKRIFQIHLKFTKFDHLLQKNFEKINCTKYAVGIQQYYIYYEFNYYTAKWIESVSYSIHLDHSLLWLVAISLW